MTDKSNRLKRAAVLAGLILVAGGAALAPGAAQARVFVSVGFPYFAPPPVFYAPPPVAYYAPYPQVAYAPPPAPVYAPPAVVYAPPYVAAPVPVVGGVFFGPRRFR